MPNLGFFVQIILSKLKESLRMSAGLRLLKQINKARCKLQMYSSVLGCHSFLVFRKVIINLKSGFLLYCPRVVALRCEKSARNWSSFEQTVLKAALCIIFEMFELKGTEISGAF